MLTAKVAAGHRLFIWVLKRFETSLFVSSATLQMKHGCAQRGPARKQTFNREGLDDWFRSYIDFSSWPELAVSGFLEYGFGSTCNFSFSVKTPLISCTPQAHRR